MSLVLQHLDLLGYRVRDCVTLLEGPVISISFDLFGCVQALVDQGVDKDGKRRDPLWMDVTRLTRLSSGPIMAPPDFTAGPVAEGKQGPSDKPAMTRLPVPALLLAVACLALGSCFQDPRTAADQCNAQHFQQLDRADIGALSGTRSRDPRPVGAVSVITHPYTVAP